MGVIGSAIGGGLKIGGSIFGGISASKAMRRLRHNIEQQMKDNQNWYDRRYNEDGTQRADAQRMISMVNESIKNRNRQAAGAAAVMGGSEEGVALAKEANNQALTDTVSNIAAQADARKDSIEREYLEEVAGNAMNAVTVGDMNLNWEGRNEDPRSMFNPDTNMETFLSCALMSGTMYAIERSGNAMNSLRMEHKLNKSEKQAESLWGDRWEDMKQQIDNANPGYMSTLLTSIKNGKDLSDEQKKLL